MYPDIMNWLFLTKTNRFVKSLTAFHHSTLMKNNGHIYMTEVKGSFTPS